MQDWLNVQFDKIKALKTNLTLGELWLTQMNEAAKTNDVFIQYCMANPRHALQSLTLSQVTQVQLFLRTIKCQMVNNTYRMSYLKDTCCNT